MEKALLDIKTRAASANDDCDVCKIAVVEMATILADPVISPAGSTSAHPCTAHISSFRALQYHIQDLLGKAVGTSGESIP